MNKAMKQLQDFLAKRKVQLDEQNKKIAACSREIEKAKQDGMNALAGGDVSAHAAAAEKCKKLESDRTVMEEFKRLALEDFTPATDLTVQKIWEDYANEVDKQLAPKVKQLIKLRGELFAATMEVLQIQDEAITERGDIAKCFSPESGITPSSAKYRLKFKTCFVPASYDAIKEVFTEERGRKGSEYLSGIIHKARLNLK